MPDLGWRPRRGWNVTLAADTDFTGGLLTSTGDDWPDGVSASMQIGTMPPIPGVVDGPRIGWVIPAATVNELIAAQAGATVRFIWIDTVTPFTCVWLIGEVQV